MPKSDFSIRRIERSDSASILTRFHYLKDISKSFKSGIMYGCFYGDRFWGKLAGVIIFTGFPVPELAVGMLGLKRDDQDGLYELSRLCMNPSFQKVEHNLTSWFVARAIKKLRQDFNVRVLLSYADNDFHIGTIYKACNFGYYGLSDAKSDFYELVEGKYIKVSRGSTKGKIGEWRKRTQKHRYALCYDKKLKILWELASYPQLIPSPPGTAAKGVES